MAEVVAVCKSKEKGIRKENIEKGVIKENYGLIGDAHADSNTHRQVSLLSIESINKMCDLGLKVGPGDFAENLTTKGLELFRLPLGTQISIGEDILLEVTQIGKEKECRPHCDIYRKLGQCIVLEEGIFAKVIHGGVVKAGDKIRVKMMEEGAPICYTEQIM